MTVNLNRATTGVRTLIIFHDNKPYLYCCPACGKENDSDKIALGICGKCGLTKKNYKLDLDNNLITVTCKII